MCSRAAGHATAHPGVGACAAHDTPPPPAPETDRYAALVTGESLRARLNATRQAETQLLDLDPEVNLLRTLVVQMADEYQVLSRALIAWYVDNQQKPKRIPDIMTLVTLVDRVGVMVERVHKLRQRTALDMGTFRRLMEAMGVVVARHVKDIRALQHIEEEWAALTVSADTRAIPPMQSTAHQLPPMEEDEDDESESD
jgi:hypothetical protein